MSKSNQWTCPTCGTKQDAQKRPPIGTKVTHPKMGKGVIVSYNHCNDADCVVRFSKEAFAWVAPLYQLQIKP